MQRCPFHPDLCDLCVHYCFFTLSRLCFCTLEMNLFKSFAFSLFLVAVIVSLVVHVTVVENSEETLKTWQSRGTNAYGAHGANDAPWCNCFSCLAL